MCCKDGVNAVGYIPIRHPLGDPLFSRTDIVVVRCKDGVNAVS